MSPPPYFNSSSRDWPRATASEAQTKYIVLGHWCYAGTERGTRLGSAFLEVIFTTQCRHALAKSVFDYWLWRVVKPFFFYPWSIWEVKGTQTFNLPLCQCTKHPSFTSISHTEVSFFPPVLNLSVENEHVGTEDNVKLNAWFEFQSLLDLGLWKFMSAWSSGEHKSSVQVAASGVRIWALAEEVYFHNQ